MVIGPDANIRYVSPAFEAILGYSSTRRSACRDSSSRTPTTSRCSAPRSPTDARHRAPAAPRCGCCHRDGTWRWFDVIVTDLSDDPSVGGWVANLRDITERKASGSRAQRSAGSVPPRVRRRADRHRARRPRRTHPAREPGDGACCSAARRTSSSGTLIIDLTHPDDRGVSDDHRERLTRNEIDFYRHREALPPARRLDGVGVAERLARARHGRASRCTRSASSKTSPTASCSPTGSRYDAAHDSMTGLLNRTSFTEHVAAALARRDDRAGRGAVHRPRPLQGRERQPRARGRRRARDHRRAAAPQHAAARATSSPASAATSSSCSATTSPATRRRRRSRAGCSTRSPSRSRSRPRRCS